MEKTPKKPAVEKKGSSHQSEIAMVLKELLESHDKLYNQVYAHEPKPDFDAIPAAKKARKILSELY